MDIFEASDYHFLLSRRAKKTIAWALFIGVAWVPPVRSWYFGQVQHHAEHLTREFMSRMLPNAPESTPPAPITPVGEAPGPVGQPAS